MSSLSLWLPLGGVVAVVKGFFDASKTEPEGFTSVAGYLGREEDFAAVEQKWCDRFVLDGIDHFHLTELFRWKRDPMTIASKYAEIISKSNLVFIGAVLFDSEWAKLPKDAEYARLFPKREHACLDMLLRVLAEELDLTWKGYKAQIVLDQDYGSQTLAAQVYDNWLAYSGHPPLASFTYASPGAAKDAPPLQYADLAAGALRLHPMIDADLKGQKLGDRGAEIAKYPLWPAMSRGRYNTWSLDVARRSNEAIARYLASLASQEQLS